MRSALLLATVVTLAATPLAAEEPADAADGADRCALAVLNLQPQGLPDDQKHVAQILTDSVATELATATECRIVTQADIASMLDFEAQKMACDTGSASCLAEIGGALGVGRVIAGSVGKLGSSFTVQMKLIDITNAEVLERVELTVAGGPEELREAAKSGARQLYGLEAGAPASPTTPQDSGGGGLAASPFLWTGVGLLTVGLVTATVGGVTTAWADAELGVATSENKTLARNLGFVALGAGAVGGVVALVGVGLLPLAFLE